MEISGFKRKTRQREVILEELHRVKDHPTAGELHERVRARLPRISLGTVYRNLERLAGAGEVNKLEFAGTETRFDAVTKPHYHVRCTACGAVDDVKEIEEELIGGSFRELGGYLVQSYRLEFLGLCPNCRRTADS
jgi:Fur family ferric uptake transcriptional regulator